MQSKARKRHVFTRAEWLKLRAMLGGLEVGVDDGDPRSECVQLAMCYVVVAAASRKGWLEEAKLTPLEVLAAAWFGIQEGLRTHDPAHPKAMALSKFLTATALWYVRNECTMAKCRAAALAECRPLKSGEMRVQHGMKFDREMARVAVRDPEPEAGADEERLSDEAEQRFVDLAKRIARGARPIAELCWRDGLSLMHAAEELGVSYNVASCKLRNARKRLNVLLARGEVALMA